jgi:hypothetical protein
MAGHCCFEQASCNIFAVVCGHGSTLIRFNVSHAHAGWARRYGKALGIIRNGASPFKSAANVNPDLAGTLATDALFNITHDYSHRPGRATEAVNGLVKIANRAGRGYSFETIRAKALLIEPGHLRECNACLGQYPESSFKSIFPEGSVVIGAEYCTGCHYRFHTEKTLHIKKGHKLYSTRVSG